MQKLPSFSEHCKEVRPICIVAGHRTWEIKKNGCDLDVDSVRAYVKQAKVRVGDFLYFGVEDLHWVDVLVFDDDGDEFTYND